MKPFTYEDVEFTTTEQIITYYENLYSDYETMKEKIHDFTDFVDHQICKMLHELTLEMSYGEEYVQLRDEIVELGTEFDFFANDVDSEIIEYNLEKGWADVVRYFSDDKDKSILYAMVFTETPYGNYDDNPVRFYAVKKKQKIVTAYEEIKKGDI